MAADAGREAAMAEMQPGEALKWVGAPQPGRAWRPALPIVLFGVPWTLFAVVWEGLALAQVLAGRSSILIPLFGLPFVGVGLALLSAPWWLISRARRTTYVISDRRVAIIMMDRTLTVRSFTGRDIANLVRRERPDGSGDLLFSAAADPSSPTGYVNLMEAPGLFGVAGVRHVERLLREMLTMTRPEDASAGMP